MHADFRGNGDYATLGLNLVLSIALGFFGGQWLDGRFDTAPYLTVAGFVFGIGAAIRFIQRAAKRMQDATAKDGFKASSTDRSARFAMQQEQRRGRGER